VFQSCTCPPDFLALDQSHPASGQDQQREGVFKREIRSCHLSVTASHFVVRLARLGRKKMSSRDQKRVTHPVSCALVCCASPRFTRQGISKQSPTSGIAPTHVMACARSICKELCHYGPYSSFLYILSTTPGEASLMPGELICSSCSSTLA
jgi:hypothetical protein